MYLRGGGRKGWGEKVGSEVFKDEESGFKSSLNCAKDYGGVPATRVKLL